MSDAVNREQIPWWDRRNSVSRRTNRAGKVKSWSSYWMDDDSYDFFYKGSKKKGKKFNGRLVNGTGAPVGDWRAGADLERAYRLSQMRRAIKNFVRIMTNRTDLDVIFSSGLKSFTNNSIVVISADDDPDKFDRVVGTALHEAAHCVFTTNLWTYTRGVSDSVSSKRRVMVKHGVDIDKINKLQSVGPGEVNVWVEDQWKIFFKLINFVEDRRIDNEVYKRAPGYRPYYQSMYDYYWNHAELAANLIHNDKLNVPTLDSYLTRVINMTNPATKYTLDRLPGFRDIVEAVDLDNILRLSYADGQVRERDTIELVAKIYNIIATNVIDQLKLSHDTSLGDSSVSCPGDEPEKGDKCKENDLPNLDSATNLSNDKKENSPSDDVDEKKDIANKVSKELGEKVPDNFDETKLADDMDSFLKDDFSKDTISVEDKNLVDALEDSKTDIDSLDVNGETVNYIRVGKLTPKVYDSLIPEKIKSDYRLRKNAPWITSGRRLGQIIVNKIQIRHDKNSHKFTRRPRGKMDPRLIHSLGLGNENVFFNKFEETYKDTVIYMTVDCSHSISSSWDQIMTMVVGFGYAAKKIHNFDVVINLRYATPDLWSIPLFDSRIDNITHLYTMASAFDSNGSTPESLIYEIEMDKISGLKTPDNNVYFITLTDGVPNTYGKYYPAGVSMMDNESLEDHCRRMMHKLSEVGIQRLAYFVSRQDASDINLNSRVIKNFKKSYGDGAKVVSMDNFNKIAETLNKFLTQKSHR